jgi:DNA-binding transcriptional regulator YiaG
MEANQIDCVLPESVLELRTLLGLSQVAFARTYEIPRSTLRGWECRRCNPKPVARTYLHMIAMGPDWVALTLQTANRSFEGMRDA